MGEMVREASKKQYLPPVSILIKTCGKELMWTGADSFLHRTLPLWRLAMVEPVENKYRIQPKIKTGLLTGCWGIL